MEVRIKYFGAVEEKVGLNEELLPLTNQMNKVSELKSFLEEKYHLSDLSYQIAVNKKLVVDAKLVEGDEVAFLPPFAGG